MNTTPMVSVIVLTYNQERYIEQALRSIVRQKVNFPFKIVIGDDCSSDRTVELCRKFERDFPGMICILEQEKNKGFQQNFIRTYNACKGKYIAICEGDDFWLSKHKLQRQVDILENHTEYAMCFHRVLNIFEKDGSKSLSNGKQKKVTSILDLASSNYITNVSILFRRGLFGDLPGWFSEVTTYDYAMHLLNAQYGNIYYLPNVMSAYRIHEKGIWSDSGIEKRQLIALRIRELLMDYFRDNEKVYTRLRNAWLNIVHVLYRYYQANEERNKAEDLINKVKQIYPDGLNTLLSTEKAKRVSLFRKIASGMRREFSKFIPLPKI